MQTETVETLLACVGPLDLFDRTRVPDDQLIALGLIVALPLARVAGPISPSVPTPAQTQTQTPAPATGEAQLVWGAAVVRRAAETGINELPVRRLETIDPRAALVLALRIEARSGTYSWSEREAIYRYAAERNVEFDAELSQLINADGSFSESMARYLRLAPRWRRAVDDGAVDVRTAEACGALPSSVLDAVTDAAHKLSFSNRRLFLTWLSELCGRDGLNEPASVKLAADLMRSRDPVETLRRLRYPRLSAMQDRFNSLQQQLTLGMPVALKAPQNFEGAAFELQLKVRSQDDLERGIETLRRIQECGDELFELL